MKKSFLVISALVLVTTVQLVQAADTKGAVSCDTQKNFLIDYIQRNSKYSRHDILSALKKIKPGQSIKTWNIYLNGGLGQGFDTGSAVGSADGNDIGSYDGNARGRYPVKSKKSH